MRLSEAIRQGPGDEQECAFFRALQHIGFNARAYKVPAEWEWAMQPKNLVTCPLDDLDPPTMKQWPPIIIVMHLWDHHQASIDFIADQVEKWENEFQPSPTTEPVLAAAG